MSSPLKTLDLTGAAVGTTGTMDFNQYPKFLASDITIKAHITLKNESGCGLDITFKASGNYHFLAAGEWGTFEVQPNDGNMAVVVDYILPNPPVSRLKGIYYMPGEQVPPSSTLGNSPIGIGGTVNTLGGTASSIQNDANPIGTSIIEATVLGDGGSAVSLTNDAAFVLGDNAHPGSMQAAGTIFANNGINTNTIRDDTHGNTAMDLTAGTGDVFMPHILTVFSSITASLMNAAALNDLALNAPTGHKVALQVGGADVVDVNASGLTLLSGKLNLLVGSLSKLSFFTGTEVATGGLHNHGLGVVPDYVLIQMTGNAADTCSFFYDPASLTSTQVKIFATNGVATPRGFIAVAIKL